MTPVKSGAPADPAAVIDALADAVPAPLTLMPITWNSYVVPPASPLAL